MTDYKLYLYNGHTRSEVDAHKYLSAQMKKWAEDLIVYEKDSPEIPEGDPSDPATWRII